MPSDPRVTFAIAMISPVAGSETRATPEDAPAEATTSNSIDSAWNWMLRSRVMVTSCPTVGAITSSRPPGIVVPSTPTSFVTRPGTPDRCSS